LLREIPFIGPIRAALLIALIRAPHRFRTKRQLWSYSGFGIETHSSAEQRFVHGELRRAKKPASIRGLNRNHELKNLFKSAATVAAAKAGRFKEFYDALVAKGMRPEMARLTLARKMAAITLLVWKSHATLVPLGQPEKAMGHESPIEPWLAPDNRAACGLRTDWLRRAKAMKTAGKENQKRCVNAAASRDHGTEGHLPYCIAASISSAE
jgi:hypothetical protein